MPVPQRRDARNSARVVRLLEADPDLGAPLSADRFEAAVADVRARVVRFGAGPWPASEEPQELFCGLLVLSGVFANRVRLPDAAGTVGRAHIEVLGPGDVLRPWITLDEAASTPSDAQWRVLGHAEVALLDGGFLRTVTQYPEVLGAVLDRLVLRSRRLNFQLAVNAVPSVSDRLLLVLWHFADRWGRVTADGVRLDLPMAHRELAEVVGASRQTVTTCLNDLREDEKLRVIRRGSWVLCGDPPGLLAHLERETSLRASGVSDGDATRPPRA